MPDTKERHTAKAIQTEVSKKPPLLTPKLDEIKENETLVSSREQSYCMAEVVLKSNKSEEKSALDTFVSVIPVIISLALLAFTVYKYFSDRADQRRQEKNEKSKRRIESIQSAIQEFYLPFQQLREQSSILYGIFAVREKQAAKDNKTTFRTLKHLCSGEALSDPDKAILKEISDVSKKTLSLIDERGHMVDEAAVSSLLGKLAAHIRLLIVAAKGKLNGKEQEARNLVFPLEIDGAIHSNLMRLKERIDQLENPGKPAANVSNKSIIFYNENAISYAASSNKVDMNEVYRRVFGLLRLYDKQYGYVLDAGCGAGRDTKYFVRQGCKVTSFDASEALVSICKKYTYSFCKLDTFDTFSCTYDYDLVWANASLLHLKEEEFYAALKKLSSLMSPAHYSSNRNNLKSAGILYFSIKNISVNSICNPGERDFYQYPSVDVEKYLDEVLDLEKVDVWDSEGGRTEDPSSFKNYLYRKR
ncbi:MAG: methyltransferase domain-containing protein [Cellvibrionaceae bacterium]|nr:methyltransferase domain-containing protein [Cellvibrionaceae bacterium]